MISLFKISIKIFFIILIFNNNLLAQNKTKIIAKVGSEIVTSFELENKIKTTLFLAGENLSQKNINSIKNVSMTSLINLKLKREELKTIYSSLDETSTDFQKRYNQLLANIEMFNQEDLKQNKFNFLYPSPDDENFTMKISSKKRQN